MLAEIYDAIGRIIEKPAVGRFREEFTDKPLRFYRVRNHYLIYDAATSPLYIARNYHAKQDIPNRFGREDI